MKTLLSMTDFVLSEMKEPYTDSERLRVIANYAAFLKQPLKLEIFVPCDENGNVLKKPKNYDIVEPIINKRLSHKSGKKKQKEKELHDYKKAKERVLFKGFEWAEEDCISYDLPNGGAWFFGFSDLEDKTIESFGGIEYQVELTPTALKQIGL